MVDYKMLGGEEARQRAKELLNSEEYKSKTKDWWENVAKNSTDDHLLDLAGYAYERVEKRQRFLQETPRSELERTVVAKGLAVSMGHLASTASELTWEEEQAKRRETPSYYHKIECWHCGRGFYAEYPLARYCTYRCTNDAYIKRRKDRREASRRNKVCQFCKTQFCSKRVDTKYCCESHRVLACLKRRSTTTTNET